ncbi:MAG: glycosyltransferase family 4 protein [bacterium]
MRILAVNWQDLTNPHAGGAEVHLEEILRWVATRGHDVTLACSGYPDCKERELIDGIEVRRRGSRNSFNFTARSLVRDLLKEKQFDLIVEDINKLPFFLPLWYKLPHLVVIPHLFGSAIYRETNPLVATYVYLSEKPIPRVYRRSRFLAISDSTKTDLVRRGIQSERISVAECGVDHEFYRPESGLAKFAQPTIVYLGRVKRYKSVQHLLEALPLIREQIPGARVVIVGTGDYLDHLRALVRSRDLEDAVEFSGYVSDETKRDYLRKAHVVVYPSPKEGWGITNIEANACGTPTVAADVPGLRDSVSVGVSGLLYEYGNIRGLADAVLKILSDRQLAETLASGALKWAARFTWDRCAAGSFAAMEQTVNERLEK